LEQIAAAAKPYNVKYEKAVSTSAADYAMKHTAFIYLIDPRFRWRVTFPFGVKSEEIASDLKYLMQVEQK
jgi:cytochrome oxidase Cu insertion factor (SCO1/SenC/PrrC family)